MTERTDPADPPLPEELAIRPRRTMFVPLGLVFAALALLCLVLGVGGLWYGWLGLALFGAGSAACFLQLSPRFAGLTLRPDGFTVRFGLKRETCRWDEVGPFRVGRVERVETVVFDRRDRTTLSDARRLVGEVRGYDHWIPRTYPMSPAELSDLMNRWRDRAI